ncbi:hypothetical protein ENUP19_0251G0009 [Entamoeba nuttalli]|uniref:Uncharacterized protein n=2 Tax=Entamoeba nuttalli TaxID=412467 RepID=K2HUZ8_ENTNP|nr:hypothetical protein ENU1_104840 [Entamoeba nuttalli P19]EKE40025.1 hypothetical protein ENU1_104840 [Entamoeba nuttalli P19]|eukprot:XP_008857637.1 hypothetical protein ENU1_104840 [Entamoeba nuttalli P19]
MEVILFVLTLWLVSSIPLKKENQLGKAQLNSKNLQRVEQVFVNFIKMINTLFPEDEELENTFLIMREGIFVLQEDSNYTMEENQKKRIIERLTEKVKVLISMFEKESESVDFINRRVKNIFEKYQGVNGYQLKKQPFDKKKDELNQLTELEKRKVEQHKERIVLEIPDSVLNIINEIEEIEEPIEVALIQVKNKLIQILKNETRVKELVIKSKQKENKVKCNKYSRINQNKSVIQILVNLFVRSINNFQRSLKEAIHKRVKEKELARKQLEKELSSLLSHIITNIQAIIKFVKSRLEIFGSKTIFYINTQVKNKTKESLNTKEVKEK